MSGERTEKPTPRRLREARREGRISRTPDLAAWGGMLLASFVLPWVVQRMLAGATRQLARLREVIATPEQARPTQLLREALLDAAVAVAPLAVGMLLVGVAAAAAQGGLHPATKQLVPKFSRLNPWQGLKRIAGPHALWETAKGLIKTVVLALVLWLSLRRLLPVLFQAGTVPLAQLLAEVASSLLLVLRAAAVAGLVMAGADYAMVRRRTMKQLRMTKQEVKEELHRTEGNPQIKQAVRSRQMAVRRGRMMADLVHADVVLVNPTHYAVALRYEAGRGAPRVVARGAGAIAARIREVAAEHRIPMVSDPPLTRSLYSACDLGDEIPPELFVAVARVLAFVMALKARGSAAGTHRLPAASAR